MQSIFIVLILTSIFVSFTIADTPAHCQNRDIKGIWKLKVGEFKDNNTCNFKFPPSPSSYNNMHQFEDKVYYEAVIDLTDSIKHTISILSTHFVNNGQSSPAQISDMFKKCEGDNFCNENIWTSIYDEGVGLRYKGYSLIAFWDFTPSNSNSLLIDTTVNCGKSFVGFAKRAGPDRQKNACFVMEKLSGYKIKKVQGEITKEFKEVLPQTTAYEDLIPASKRLLVKSSASNSNPTTDHKIKVLARSISDSVAASTDQNWNLIMEKKFASPWVAFVDANKGNLMLDNDEKDEFGYPRSVNWETIIPDAVNQGTLGTCYLHGTRHYLLTQAKIRYNEKKLDISLEHIMNCNFMAQGSVGGFGYEVNNFLRFHNTMTTNCWNLAKGDCNYKCNEFPQQRVKEFGFVGSWYGDLNNIEERMVKELQNGPIEINFDPTPFYSLNKYNTLDDDYVLTPSEDYNLKHKQINNQKDGWERIGHEVMIYGYGVNREGKKFWRMQNSWGKRFADQGRIKIRKGINAMGIESMPESSVAKLIYSRDD